MVLLSLALHGAAFASLAKARRAPVRERIELEVVRREPPPAPAPPPASPPPRPRPVERRVALERPARPPRSEPAAPPPALPPPASAPAEPQPASSPIARVGISLGSTVSSGGFAVGVGNTAYGRAEETAADPVSVRPLRAGAPGPSLVAAARLSVQPRPLELPRIAYPAEARKAGSEGRVVLLLRIDEQGSVTSVRVLDAPSPSLAGAALEGARRFRFAPALLDGAPVPTEIRFTYTFLLE